MPRFSEASICKAVARAAEHCGWTVYAEVSLPTPHGGRAPADLVLQRGDETTIVEAKKALTWQLIEQAERWVGMANYSIAVCPSTSAKWKDIARKATHAIGVGLIFWPGGKSWDDLVADCGLTPGGSAVEQFLDGKQKGYSTPGAGGQRRWSPTRAWLDQVEQYVQRNPGCTVRDVARSVQHGLRSNHLARNQIVRAAERGGVDVRIEEENGIRTLFPKNEVHG